MTTTPVAAAPPAQAAPARKPKLPREQDPRNPAFRLAALLDEGSVELVSPDDDSGMLAAVGTISGAPVVAFCSDATVMGGAIMTVYTSLLLVTNRRYLPNQIHLGGYRRVILFASVALLGTCTAIVAVNEVNKLF